MCVKLVCNQLTATSASRRPRQSAIECIHLPPVDNGLSKLRRHRRIATEIMLAKLGETGMPFERLDNQALLNSELVLRESA